MKEEPDSLSVPYNFSRCFNDQCPQALSLIHIFIYSRADAQKPHMELTTWKNAPDGRVQKSDTIIAQNYLSDKEVSAFNQMCIRDSFGSGTPYYFRINYGIRVPELFGCKMIVCHFESVLQIL